MQPTPLPTTAERGDWFQLVREVISVGFGGRSAPARAAHGIGRDDLGSDSPVARHQGWGLVNGVASPQGMAVRDRGMPLLEMRRMQRALSFLCRTKHLPLLRVEQTLRIQRKFSQLDPFLGVGPAGI